jgi:hypothetical protein
MAISFKTIAPYLQTDGNRSSRVISYIGLGIGMLLLLCSIQLFVNLNQLMKERTDKKTGFDFIAISKRINDSNMGQSLSFRPAEIDSIKSQPFIEDATPLLANKFIVSATGGSALPFTTDIFLEAIDNSFIDTLPPSFQWKEGDNIVPIIVSSDYLELYNTVFAPSRDLPQISEQTMGALLVQLECSGIYGTKTFRGNIVALSDRINSVIVPGNFLQWANKNIANMPSDDATRVYIKTTDANSVDFLNYLQSKNYQVNKDKTRFGRIKQVLQVVVSGLGIFAALVILLAMLLFSFYLQLMIARSKDNLQLLLTLGYSPNWLSSTVAKKWIPIYIIIVIVALCITQLLQYLFTRNFQGGPADLSPWIHPWVIFIALAMMLICVTVNYSLIKKLLNKL